MTTGARMKKALIANRGEIAVRLIRECRRRGVRTALAVSSADRDSLGARLADDVICIGPPPAARSYLLREAVLQAAVATGCDAIHPGYGFLSEDPDFAEMCSSEGVVFIGPRPELLRLFGDKITAREAAAAAGLRLSPGSDQVADLDVALRHADRLGFPVLLKPANGGGGKGMRLARSEAELRTVFDTAVTEAQAAFGSGRLYLEHWVERARHVEVQIAGDGNGGYIHLGGRDCSVQRRNQKLIEEAPAPELSDEVQQAIRTAAVALAKHVAYDSIGTVEFLVDAASGDFYFMEVNPRLQVEHGVTELVTGIDLVDLQMTLAETRSMPITQKDVRIRGSAFEIRVNAERPEDGFAPSPGRITDLRMPAGPGVRVDSHLCPGYLVPPFYDSLLAKVMAYGSTRSHALARMDAALTELHIDGVSTTAGVLRAAMAAEEFRTVGVHTTWMDGWLAAHLAGTASAA
jgi:acetyl-CoA carboxylase biotin carboxylase subunit